MLRSLKNMLKRATERRLQPSREQLQSKYPDHLGLIDSAEIPTTYKAGPDLSYYTEGAEFYYQLICESATALKDRPLDVANTGQRMVSASVAYNRIVHAVWGLIAKGSQATPYAVNLSKVATVI